MFAEITSFDKEAYLARRKRLGQVYTKPQAQKLLTVVPEPVFVPVGVDVEPEGYVPLNMLAPPSWKFLLAYCCLKHSVSQKAVLSGRRNLHIIACRYEAMALVYTHQKRSTPEMGKMFNRDHTAILHALRKAGVKKLPIDFPADHKSRPTDAPLVVINPASKRVRASGKTALQQAIKRGYAAGASALDIAEAYGASVKSVHVIAHKLGLEHPNYRRNK